MGAGSTTSSNIMDTSFLKTLSLETPLKSLDSSETEVH